MSPDEMRRLATTIRRQRPRHTHDQYLPEFYFSVATHAIADGLTEMADELDPPKPPPFDIAAARLDNAVLGAENRTMRGAA